MIHRHAVRLINCQISALNNLSCCIIAGYTWRNLFSWKNPRETWVPVMCRQDQHTRPCQPICSLLWINLTLLGSVPADVTLQPATEKKEHYVPGPGSKMFSPALKALYKYTALRSLFHSLKFSWTNSSKKVVYSPSRALMWCGWLTL